ncbi:MULTISPECIES: DUF4159 domain-containing protein [unclassified Tenacibaculum]|uniref:DUF4159 domain-containing protein n=1 Tax=unclassified Tenacibaculum TaxID=2635139 RepID=UPI001F2EF394|nr:MULTISPECIES: DUF4159 domain-containing protein [unclassified Tenacibaculum]MCF2876149.1 DUF4159 domain-containing protein [Tenacibaculum sp. Cn5-1]MCF2936224.1 DUF4159 domain-containing protein [Tenacibaculum sp. Cn5-34]MCG7511567.1 DUF4159 domain-containing protein [Tenacibaculum sp. Cn5-46]
MKKALAILFLINSFIVFPQQIAVLKYQGGGDWYANPTALPNLIEYSNLHTKTLIDKNIQTVSLDDETVNNYPIIFLTGHGNVFFSNEDAENLKNYLISGGFLHISDNYGLNKYIRRELKKVFPSLKLQEIPNNHPIYHQTFSFPNGLPKIHEHDKKPPQGFGLFYKGRLIVFYDYESDLSDGWEDSSVHNNPKEVREKALKMGSNIIEYAFKN